MGILDWDFTVYCIRFRHGRNGQSQDSSSSNHCSINFSTTEPYNLVELNFHFSNIPSNNPHINPANPHNPGPHPPNPHNPEKPNPGNHGNPTILVSPSQKIPVIIVNRCIFSA
jgi:hypothetical protein